MGLMKRQIILTKYISNPHLINKLKYDFRINMLIKGLALIY